MLLLMDSLKGLEQHQLAQGAVHQTTSNATGAEQYIKRVAWCITLHCVYNDGSEWANSRVWTLPSDMLQPHPQWLGNAHLPLCSSRCLCRSVMWYCDLFPSSTVEHW